jgi:8-amino-7-oxononanoate synthase
LGLSEAAVSRETNVESRLPSGAAASRLIHGTHPQHHELESELADWVGFESSLLFTSGYAANIGLLQAVGGPGVAVISDALNHASIIDGCRLSRARVEVVPHLSLEAIERTLDACSSATARCVVTESYFSMDGDGPDLRALRALCDRFDAALVVDEAHALGVLGPSGAGRCREAGIKPDALVGTFGKAVGTQGAFVAGSSELRELLWNRARSFVFSTAPSPRLAALTRFHVQQARTADPLRVAVLKHADALRRRLCELGCETPATSFGPIVPVLVGDERACIGVVERLADMGILGQAIRPPTVPAGTSRIRLTAKATWTDETPSLVANAVADALVQGAR